jgi:signal transduction histidine kinase
MAEIEIQDQSGNRKVIEANGFVIESGRGRLAGTIMRDVTERKKNDISRIADAAEKMQQLICHLLDLSRVGRIMDPSRDVPFDVIVNDVVNTVAGQIEIRGARVSVSPELPIIHGDRVRLTQVMQNLIENAINSMGDQPEPQIEIGMGEMEDGKPIFYVRDNGVGSPPEHQERIFGLFNKLSGNSDGTGIGLALVKRIIEVHGCRIWVQSEAGKGTTFLFTLPSPPKDPSHPSARDIVFERRRYPWKKQETPGIDFGNTFDP